MSWFSPVIGYTAAGALLAGLLGGWTVRDWKADADSAAAVQEAIKLRDRIAKDNLDWSTKYEQLREQQGQQRVETRNTIREIYRDVKVPAECAAPSSAVRVLGSARDRANASAAGKPVSPMQPSTQSAGSSN